jgi:hypothetical protein
MARKISIAELQGRGVAVRPDEAVAVVQQVIAGLGRPQAANLTPPFGPPSPSTVLLKPDGTVACASCGATIAVSEAARLLQELLPSGLPVAGGLRYTIARALLEVDAPPFDSLEDFSAALARHERGERTAVVRGLIDRAAEGAVVRPSTPLLFDRRRSPACTADLRRELREADARAYDQLRAIDALSAMTPRGPRTGLGPVAVIASGLAIGLALIGAGEGMHLRRAATAVGPAPAVAPIRGGAPAPAADQAIAMPDRIGTGPAPDAVRAVDAPISTRPAPKPIVTRTSHVRRPPPHDSRTGVLRRLHLRWLKSRIVLRSEPL